MLRIIVVLLFLGETAFAQVSPILSLEHEAKLQDIVGRASAHFHPEFLPEDSPYHLHQGKCGTIGAFGLAFKLGCFITRNQKHLFCSLTTFSAQ